MTIWKKFKALLSGMEHNRRVPRHPAHLLYALMNLLAILAALVMHGDVRFTLSVIVLLLPAACVVFIPYRYFNILSRMMLNACIFGAGCFWIMFRMKHDIPLDKMMIEVLALWSLTFLVSGSSRGYFYLMFIDILLLLYAGLLPRLISLYLSIGAFVTLLIILFRNRTGFLSGDMLLRSPRKTLRRTWHCCLLWIIISGVIFHFIFGMIPLRDNSLEGFVPVSFNTGRESFASPKLQEWLNSGKDVKNSPEGQKSDERAEGENMQLSRNEGKSIQLPDTPRDSKVAPGNGGSSMGNDLVFRVKSPLKLYHLARLYDHYNGTEWRASRRMLNNRSRNNNDEEHNRVKLFFSLEKIYSAHLAIPWQILVFQSDEKADNALRYKNNFWGITLKSFNNTLPLKFSAEIALPSMGVDEKNNPVIHKWDEYVSRSAYLRLPSHNISHRVRSLAKSITADCRTPYAKALALRDFLRSNYSYKLHAAVTPRHRESVDYFLFFLGEGHCEYFASALAVMARCVGLPSRVATGFSPGNYNTLTSLFEVFEYHAHAWTQIYIPEFGWLTFDATPPSAVVSETSPRGFGKMRDPFGDEWRIRPPELTEDTLDYMDKLRIKAEQKRKNDQSQVTQALNEIASAGEKLREELKKEHNSNQSVEPGELKKYKKRAIDIAAIRKKAIEMFRLLQDKLVDLALYAVSSWSRLLVAVGSIIAGVLFILWIVKLLKLLIRHIILHWLIRSAEKQRDPGNTVRYACRAALLLLELNHMGRDGNQELMEYGSLLRRDLVPEACGLFAIFYRSSYRSGETLPADAEKALSYLAALRNGLKGHSVN